MTVLWGTGLLAGPAATAPWAAEAEWQWALLLLWPGMGNTVDSKQGACLAALLAPSQHLVHVDMSKEVLTRLHRGLGVHAWVVRESGAAGEPGSSCGAGISAGIWAQGAGVMGRAARKHGKSSGHLGWSLLEMTVPKAFPDALWLLVGKDGADATQDVHTAFSCSCFRLLQASNGQCYQMNNDLVRSSNIKVVHMQQAYMLFYLR